MPIVEYHRITLPAGGGAFRAVLYGGGSDIPVDGTTGRENLVPGTYIPDETNTGVLYDPAVLTVITGNITYTTPNQVIENKMFYGQVFVNVAGVHFKNCWFRGPISSASLDLNGYQGDLLKVTLDTAHDVLVEDCTFDASYGAAGGPGHEDIYRTRFARNSFYGHGTTFRRCRFRYTIDGMQVVPVNATGARADVVLEGCFIDQLTFYSPDSNHGGFTHNDCIQWQGGRGLRLTGNRFQGFYNANAGDSFKDPATNGGDGNQYLPKQQTTSVLMCAGPVGSRDPMDEFIAEKNWFNGGGVALSLSSTTSTASFTDGTSHIINNYFGYDYRDAQDLGVMAKAAQAFELTGNVRWGGPTPWTHGNEASVDPYDTSTPFNVRKPG